MPSYREKIEGLYGTEMVERTPPGYSGTGEMVSDAYKAFLKWSTPEERNKRLAEQFPPFDETDPDRMAEMVLNFMPFGAGVKGIGGKRLMRRMAKSKWGIDIGLSQGLRSGQISAEELTNVYRGLRARGAMGNTPGELMYDLTSRFQERAEPTLAALAKEGKHIPAEKMRRIDVFNLDKIDAHLPISQDILEGLSQEKAAQLYIKPETFFAALARGWGISGKQEMHQRLIGMGKNVIPKYAKSMRKGDKFPTPWLGRRHLESGPQTVAGPFGVGEIVGKAKPGRHHTHEGRHRTMAAAIYHGAEEIPVLVEFGSKASKRPQAAFRRFGKHEPAPPSVQGPPRPELEDQVNMVLKDLLGKTRSQATESEIRAIRGGIWKSMLKDMPSNPFASGSPSSAMPMTSSQFDKFLGSASSSQITSSKAMRRTMVGAFSPKSLSERRGIEALVDAALKKAGPEELELLKKMAGQLRK